VGASDVCRCNRLGARSVSELPSRTPVEGKGRGEKEQRYRGDQRCRRNRRSLRFLEGDELGIPVGVLLRIPYDTRTWKRLNLFGMNVHESPLLVLAEWRRDNLRTFFNYWPIQQPVEDSPVTLTPYRAGGRVRRFYGPTVKATGLESL
jgi:hypothetical protein